LPENVISALATLRAQGHALRVSVIGTAKGVHGADQCLPDPRGQARLRYGVAQDGAAYLLRPDQHICARWTALTGTRLLDAFLKMFPT
jgi:3-(3-hydroxy-phenyl)propionate hydroxylase